MIRFKHINDTIIMTQKQVKLNKRQDRILAVLKNGVHLLIAEIAKSIESDFAGVPKITINRDLQKLIDFDFVSKSGRGRATTYGLTPHFKLIERIDVQKYFQDEADKRIFNEMFNFNIFSFLRNLFTEEEKKKLNTLNSVYKNNIKKLSETLVKKEFERLLIELSWKSSQIEGNTYTLLETEALLKNNKKAKGHEREESIMILNHKKTFDYIRSNKDTFKIISVSKIEDVHSLLVLGLGIPKNIRNKAVGITGTKYRPLDNQFQVREALEKSCALVNDEKDPFAKALLLSVMIAYIQPFEDGNKRTSRLMGNAMLIAYDMCPLSYRSVDEVEYKKAVILFYEQNNINYFKQLFVEQFEFAVGNYFKTKDITTKKA